MSEETSRYLSRRSFLTVAAAASAGLTGCPGGGPDTEEPPTETPTDTPTPTDTDEGTETPPSNETESPVQTTTEEPSRFDEIIDVTEVGAARDASESITPLIHEHAADDTVLEFPSGTYAIDVVSLSGLTNVGLRAAEGADPTLVPTEPTDELGTSLVRLVDVKDLLVDGFELDFTQEGYGGMVYVLGTDNFEFRNVTVNGPYPPNVTGFRFEAVTPESEAIVENLEVTGGSVDGSTSVGIYVGHTHAGTLTIENATVANFPNNGLYASSPGRQEGYTSTGNGPVHVVGGRYENNNIANVRLGSSGSTARDVTVVVDEVPPVVDDILSPRGIRLRAREGQLIENCDVTISSDVPDSLGGIVLHHAVGQATIRDTSVQVDTDGVPAINGLSPDDAERGPIIENVDISGSAARDHAINIVNRDGTEVHGCTIEQTGDDRCGIRFLNSNDCIVANTQFDVTGEPITTVDSNVVQRDISYGNPTDQQDDRRR